jgi:hypothetical protein
MEPEASLPSSQEPVICVFPEPDYSNLPPIHCSPKIHFNIILPSTPRPCEWFFSHAFSFSPCALYAAPACLILLDLSTLLIFGEKYKLWSASLCSVLLSVITSPLLGPDILLSALLSHTLNVRDQVSNPRKATRKTTVLYFKILCF